VDKQTACFARFSTVAGERGAADAERDVRGFALKFYTEEGNWDMVGNNTPVFFVRDPYKFPDFIRGVPCTTTTRTAICAFSQAAQMRTRTTSQIRSAARWSGRSSPNRRSRSVATQRVTTTARGTTTTRSRGRYFISLTRNRRPGSSPTSPRRCGGAG